MAFTQSTRAASLALCFFSLLYAQPSTQPASTQPAAPNFPSAWTGHWKGEAQLIANNKIVQSFVTELIIRPTDDPNRFDWTIIYDGKTGRQERPYTLVVKDAAKGAYEIDEGQGIILPATLLGDVLASSFEVMGNRIDATYELRTSAHSSSIAMLLVTKKAASAVQTGGKDGVPEVTGWTPVSLQRCVMKKVE